MKLTRILTIATLALTTMTAIAATPRYVFYFIGDGMGMGHVMTAQAYNRMVLGSDSLLTMMRFPVSGIAMTYSASSPVTDSAAAGTALSTGFKTSNGMLGMNPDTLAVNSIAKTLHDEGWGIGVITTVAADDATPGAFYAHVPKRSMYYEIGRQAADCGYEFIAGAGLRGLEKNGESTGLEEYIGEKSVKFARGIEQITGEETERIMLVGADGHPNYNAGYTIDSIAGALTLPAMTQACLNHLERNAPERFFMMVEGGNIDHAAHANDAGAVIIEILNFNEALDIAHRFYLAHPDETLIVVTADHDTGGMTLGNADVHYNALLQYFASQRVSKEQFSAYCKAMLKSRMVYTWEDMAQYLTDNFGFWTLVPLTDEQTAKLREEFEHTFEQRNTLDEKTLYASFNRFSSTVFSTLASVAGIGWTTTSHTGNPVPVFAIGPGAEAFANINNNIEIPAKILEILNK